MTAPATRPAYQELCQIIVACQQEIFRLKLELAQNEASTMYVTNAIRGALPASELEYALRALLNTERGRRLLGTALRPSRDNVVFNKAAEVARRILGI